MTALLRALTEQEWACLEREDPPTNPEPMLGFLAHEPFSDPEWLFERKLDGERALAVSDGAGVRLVSRNGKDLTDSYPEVPDALTKMWVVEDDSRSLPSFVLDGEIVASSESVRSSFSLLQERIRIDDPDEARESDVRIHYYLFDLLHLSGYDLARLPLLTRKRILRQALAFSDPLRFTSHRHGDGELLLDEACRKGWEGVMAKRASSPYRHARSSDWLKLKCVNRQELVVGGYTEPRGTRIGFGALLVGHFDGASLRYAGKVGTGFDGPTLKRLARLLEARERETSPFSSEDAPELPEAGVHWVRPDLVGRFGFTEWTRTGKLRHPRFLGLRRDKDPHDVRREGYEAKPDADTP